MNGIQKIALAIVTVGMITALTLKDRQTPQVIDSVRKLFTGALGTAIKG
jgi:hypothetical protein